MDHQVAFLTGADSILADTTAYGSILPAVGLPQFP